MWTDPYLLGFARWASKSPMKLSIKQHFAFAIPLLIMTIIMVWIILPQYLNELSDLPASGVRFPFNSDWRVHYDDPRSNTLLDCVSDPICIGNPTNNFLFEKGALRDNPEHHQILSDLRGKTFWIGTKIKKEIVENAKREGLHVIMVGFLWSTYELRWNGKIIKTGNWKSGRDLITIALSEAEMVTDQDSIMTIRMVNDSEHGFPDHINWKSGLGFATADQIKIYERFMEFYNRVLNSISMGFNLALSLLFFAFWLCNPKKQELILFSAYGLLYSFTESIRTPLVWHHLGESFLKNLYFVTTIYEPLFILLLAFSITRLRSKFVFAFSFTALVFPWCIFFTNFPSMKIFIFSNNFSHFFSPLCYISATLLCFSQARLVSQISFSEIQDPGRVYKLHAAAVLIALICIIHASGVYGFSDLRVYNSFALIGLATTIVADYRRQELLIRRSPISKYHLKSTLPEKINCVMTSVDLKKSEDLYRLGLEFGQGSLYVQEVMSRFYKEILTDGGEIVQSEGDSLIYFFDEDESTSGASPIKKAIDSVERLNKILLTMANEDFGIQKQSEIHAKRLKTALQNLRLRAAISDGQLKPTFQRCDGRDIPIWSQIGEKNIFVEVARLLEVESSIGTPMESVVLFKEDVVKNNYNQHNLNWKARGVRLSAKHGREIHVAAASLPLVG